LQNNLKNSKFCKIIKKLKFYFYESSDLFKSVVFFTFLVFLLWAPNWAFFDRYWALFCLNHLVTLVIDQLKVFIYCQDVEKMILANKCDMEEKRVISKERGESIARENGVRFLETSAKTNVNIERAFMELSENILEKTPGIQVIHFLQVDGWTSKLLYLHVKALFWNITT